MTHAYKDRLNAIEGEAKRLREALNENDIYNSFQSLNRIDQMIKPKRQPPVFKRKRRIYARSIHEDCL